MKKIRNFFLLLRDNLTGDFAYKNYLKHFAKNHRDEKILDKKNFLRERGKEKWEKINRCC
jgi:uncharacterized short protein YbdD (DUF466 family)